MQKNISETPAELGVKSAARAAGAIRKAIAEKDYAHIILATGASQFETLKNLTEAPDIDWSKVIMFHLDEYAGLSQTHPASFRKYLQERFVDKVDSLAGVHFIQGDTDDPAGACRRLGELISGSSIDIALVGIGENGHLAFNDPPADFDTKEPYIVVTLDLACRKQQMGEGWFASVDEVPEKAISMSIQQILASKEIVCSVPDKRKAQAVKECLEGPVTNRHPASILQQHPACTVYLDRASASLLSG